MTKDLTVGTPYKVILKFAIPMILGSLFQQVYNMADSLIVGRLVGENALAGVGATGSLNFLIIGFIIGLNSGFSIPIAQAFGAKDMKKIGTYFGNALFLIVGLTIVLTTLTLVFLEEILILMNTPEEIMHYTYLYASTMFMGLGGTFLYNLMASVMRALGDSKTPLYFLIFSSFLNVVLSLIFVIFFNWGVFGTGLGTVISQSVSGILCIITARRKFKALKIGFPQLMPQAKVIKKLLAMGIPMGLQISITGIGTIVIQAAINSLGAVYVLAVSTSMKIAGLFMQGFDTLGLAMATYAGQNIGAGKIDRVKKGVKQAIIMGVSYGVVVLGILYLIGGYVAGLFVVNPSVELSQAVHQYLLANAAFYTLLTILFILRNTIQGLGFSSLTMMSGISEMIMRCVVAFGLVGHFGFTIILFTNPIAWTGALLVLVPLYIYAIKKVSAKASDT